MSLPNKPSELIRVGLADLRKVEADPDYRVDMDMWHSPNRGERVCVVCLAGAVMAKTIKVPSDMYFSPRDLPQEKKLKALNCFRKGFVGPGVELMGMHVELKRRDITPYDRNREQFHADMQQLASDLEKLGL